MWCRGTSRRLVDEFGDHTNPLPIPNNATGMRMHHNGTPSRMTSTNPKMLASMKLNPIIDSTRGVDAVAHAANEGR